MREKIEVFGFVQPRKVKSKGKSQLSNTAEFKHKENGGPLFTRRNKTRSNEHRLLEGK